MPAQITAAGLYFLAIGAGVSFVVQQAVNANLRAEIGSPFWAGLISYLGGSLAMLLAVLALREAWPSPQTIARSSGMSWTGGLFGAIYIAISILLLPRLGAATVLALIVLGQMLTAITFDHFALLGAPQHSASMVRLAGVGLIVAGVVLVKL